ncbi:glutathione S-transferase N-terminal domain-containing protein [Rhodobacteraceae bacterium N5(2021)]|uniref:Glutathione S-transferase N-terminal domain-containing protein n=1 Tax=Gymnodinialimonas phycosphaerae TaxID=2841589 RepID=A0A975TYJ0_9RHOB|nr:glutathione S-transferase N-terminal domain-containing protein [Gymnodinialimonas phycosphaerae]MBY4892796.1 glutathione S-transferase N-terminal domain-containing protein [Gymnodinialimonas phycosphaerae]
MIVWGRPSSVNVQKVLWALTEHGMTFENRVVGGKYGGTDTEAFAAMTPVPRVPVLQDGDLTLWESHAILRYLSGGVSPLADQWMEYTTSTLQPAFLRMFYELVRTAPEARVLDAAALIADFLAAVPPLEWQLAKTEWLGGDSFGMADVAAGAMMYRACDLCDPLTPEVARWYEQLKDRAAYRDIVMTSYEELRG